MRGNTAAGKTRSLKSDPLFENVVDKAGEVSGAINPDTYKATLRAIDADPNRVVTAFQAHEEGSMLAKRLAEKIETAEPPLSNLSVIIDKRLNQAKNIDELIEMGKRTGKPIKILDVDAPLEASAQGVLSRAIAGPDPAVPFHAIADGFRGIRKNRRALIEKVRNDPNIKNYVLYVTDEVGKRIKVAEKKSGVFKIMDDPPHAKRLFEEATSPNTEAIIEKVKNTRITDEYIKSQPEYVQQGLQRYEGMTLGEALEKHSILRAEPADMIYYLRESMGNLRNTSRAAKGVIDTSASADKAAKMAGGLTKAETAKLVNGNFEKVIRRLHAERKRQFRSPRELQQFFEQMSTDINKGLVKEGVLIRKGADSTKYPYTKVADLPKQMEQFYKELFRRMSDPKQDPVALAAWIEYRVNFTDHFFADGCGKSSQALATFVLMRKKIPMPRLKSKKEILKFAPKTIRNPRKVQTDHVSALDGLTEFYRSRLNSME